MGQSQPPTDVFPVPQQQQQPNACAAASSSNISCRYRNFVPPEHQPRKLPSRTSEGYRGLGLGLGLVLGYDLKLEFRYN